MYSDGTMPPFRWQSYTFFFQNSKQNPNYFELFDVAEKNEHGSLGLNGFVGNKLRPCYVSLREIIKQSIMKMAKLYVE